MNTRIVYVSIGNSDNKLRQDEWAAMCQVTRYWCKHQAQTMFGEWYALPDSQYQNACFGFRIEEHMVPKLKHMLEQIRVDFRQDSIAWAEAQTTLIGVAE